MIVLSMTRGDTFAFGVRMRDKASQEPIPFEEGDLVIFTVRAFPVYGRAGNPVLIERRITVFDGGAAGVTLLPADTNDLPTGDYAFDVELRKPNGDVHTVIRSSKLTLGEEVTRYDQ